MTTFIAQAVTYPPFSFIGWNVLLIGWETTAIALLLAGSRLSLTRASARSQYAAAVAAFAIAALLGAVTPIALLSAPVRASAVIERIDLGVFAGRTALTPPAVMFSSGSHPVIQLPSANGLAGLGGLLWCIGVLLLAGRLCGGWIALQRLCHRTERVDSAEVQRIVTDLRLQFGLSLPVTVLQSDRIEAPVALGWRRPIIILPTAAAEQLGAEALELLMAHEFAHIVRRDYVANLVQSVAEVFLFFSPGALWISRKVREAREFCCDDVTVQECGDRKAYVRALTMMAGLGSRHTERPALGVAGPRLITRVRRLLQENAMPKMAIGRLFLVSGALAVVAVSGVSVAGCAVSYASQLGATDSQTPRNARITTAFPARQPGAYVFIESSTGTTEHVCEEAVLRNTTDVPVVATAFVAIVEQFGQGRPVQIFTTDLLPTSTPIPPGETRTVRSSLLSPAQVRAAAPDSSSRMQVMCGLLRVRFANGAEWRTTPNPAASSGSEALNFPPSD